jgi:hypothetical protein
VEELRRKRIQDALQAIAAGFRNRGGSSLSLISSPSGDQDAAAFRLMPRPERRAPVPIDAFRFQPRR